VESALCKYGMNCQFAHGKHELRPAIRHPKYKTEICTKFVHNPSELRTLGELSEVVESDFVGDISLEEVVTDEQRAIEEKIAQLHLGLLAPIQYLCLRRNRKKLFRRKKPV